MGEALLFGAVASSALLIGAGLGLGTRLPERLLAENGDPRSGRLLAPASIARRASALNGYDRNRHHLSRHATYQVAAAMADDYTRADD
jgi:hypothetical protein